jgi:pimeloyl-ACP methyl ester carboxylesterase
MAEKINTDEPYYLVGLSFGGMLATEMLTFLKPQKTIFISSVLLRKELPLYFKFWFTSIGAKLMPRALITQPNRFIHFIFGVTSIQEKQLLDTIVKESNPDFVFWAIQQVLNFKQNKLPNVPYIRIHGTKDKILPIHHFIPTYTIAKGSHFMVANRAKEISAILAKEMR